MDKIASYNVIDFYGDKFLTELEKIAKSSKLPEWVQKAEVLSEDSLHKLSDDDFALVAVGPEGKKRYFCLVDKAHTFLSMVYFNKSHKKLPTRCQEVAAYYIRQALQDFEIYLDDHAGFNKFMKLKKDIDTGRDLPINSNVYNSYDLQTGKLPEKVEEARGIKPPEEIKGVKEELEKKASVEFWGVTTPSGNTYYELDTPAEVEAAVVHFGKYASRIAPEYQLMYADNIIKRADVLEVELPDELQRFKHASIDFVRLPDLFSLRFRKSSGEVFNGYRALFNKSAEMAPTRFITLLLNLDKEAGLDRLWDVSNPLDIIQTKPEPTDMVKTAHVEIPKAQLMKVAADPTVLQKYFDSKVASAFMEDPVTIFNSLPRPHQTLVARIARGEVT